MSWRPWIVRTTYAAMLSRMGGSTSTGGDRNQARIGQRIPNQSAAALAAYEPCIGASWPSSVLGGQVHHDYRS